MEQNQLIKDLTGGNVTKELLKYAAPFVAASLLQVLYNMVDLIVVGQFVGSVGLSAVGIGGHLLILITTFVIGFSSGGQIYIAQIVGSGQIDRLNRTIGTLFTLLFASGALISVIGVIFSPSLIGVLNTPSEAVAQTRDYMVVCCSGVIFIAGYNVVSAILRGMGESRLPLWFALIATIVNIILDLVFVGALGMKSGGAALATIIGQGVSFIISIIYLYRHKDAFGFDFKLKSYKPVKEPLVVIVKLGLPMGIQQILIQTSMMYVNACINACGITASAVDAVGSKINGLMGVVSSSMHSASAAMIGQNIAAGKTDRVSKVFWTNEIVNTIFLAGIAVVFLLFPAQVFGIFNNEPEVLGMAPLYLKITLVMFATFAWMSAPLGLINGVGNARLNMILALFDGFVVRIGLTVLLGDIVGLGLTGYWLGNASAGFTTVIVGGVYYFSGLWKKRKLLVDS